VSTAPLGPVALLRADLTDECPADQLPIDTAWMLTSAMRILAMQAGFALLESAFTRKMNEGSIMFKNILDVVASAIAFYYVGYGLAFGDAPEGVEESWYGVSTGFEDGAMNEAFWFFQFSFAGTATTINSGALAERVNFWTYFLMSLVISGVTYPLVVHWCWGGTGFLGAMGFCDFAGGMVVHGFGGVSAVTACYFTGPRIGQYKDFRAAQGLRRKIFCEKKSDLFYRGPVGVEHKYWTPVVTVGNPVQMLFGTLILWVAWFAFNSGSTTALTSHSDTVASKTMISTTLGAAGGAVTAIIVDPLRNEEGKVKWTGKVSIPNLASCILAGLVGITAGNNAFAGHSAFLIGILSGLVYYGSAKVVKKCRIDDVVGAFAVHGGPGMFGTIMVGFLGEPDCEQPDYPTGVLLGGDGDQVRIQIVGVVAIALWAFASTFIMLMIIHMAGLSLRCERHKELLGLDYCEHASEETQAEDPLRAQALIEVLRVEQELERLLYHSDADKPLPEDAIWAKAAPPAWEEMDKPMSRKSAEGSMGYRQGAVAMGGSPQSLPA